MPPLQVTVFGENIHENKIELVRQLYPQGMHGCIAQGIREHLGEAAQVRTVTLQEPEHGLTEEVLRQTDVLVWWGHAGHHLVQDTVAERVQNRVLSGMGLIVLHSGHGGKVFRKLMGTSCAIKWREAGELERIWSINPGHPIADGLPEYFELPHEEMYGEFFDIPAPDELVFISWFEGGEVFRSGCCWSRGKGSIFYFRPGHETFPTYHDAHVRRVIANGVRHVAPRQGSPYSMDHPNVKTPLSPIATKHVVDESVHKHA